MTRKTGARGLRSVMERVLQQAMFKMPGSGEKKFTMTVEMVKDSLYSKPSSGGGNAKKSKTDVA